MLMLMLVLMPVLMLMLVLMRMLMYRTPELLHQPSMLGLDQGGITETIEYALTKFSADQQRRLCQVCVTVIVVVNAGRQ